MASAIKISTGASSAGANAEMDRLDAGSGPGTVKVYTGSPPANCAASPTGTLLCTGVGSDPFWGAASSGVKTANAIADDADCAATGDAGYFRLLDSNGNVELQGTAGNAADSPDMVFDNKSIVQHGRVVFSSMTATMPTA